MGTGFFDGTYGHAAVGDFLVYGDIDALHLTLDGALERPNSFHPDGGRRVFFGVGVFLVIPVLVADERGVFGDGSASLAEHRRDDYGEGHRGRERHHGEFRHG